MSSDDWCHFSVPVQRNQLHRRLKGASKGDESEKFSYLVATRRELGQREASRIVKRPIKAKGHVHLDVCNSDGLVRRTLSKRDAGPYKVARKAAWGDLLNADN